MACKNKKTRQLRTIILCLMLYGLPLVTPRNIDCKGKPFHCVNSTNFIICVDLGGGMSSTVDDVIIPCPESTICDINNYFECEFPPPTTLTLPIQPSDVSNESGLGKNKVITKVSWENIEVTTTSPMQKTSERSEKYLNNASITIPEEFTTTKAKLEAITDNNQTTTIQQGNINSKYQNYSNEKQYKQFTGNSTIDESSNLDVAQSDINKDENTNGSKLNSYTIDTRPTQANEELKDRKLSSVGTGTESTPLQSSMSPTDTTEFYSYTPDNNRDVITFEFSFTTNSEMSTSEIMSVNTPISSNSRSKKLQVLKTEKETTPYAVTASTITESKKTITLEPKAITLSYNSSNSSSQINSYNSPAYNLVNEYQSTNSSNDTDNTSYLNEFSVTESLRNITSRVSENYLQNNSTQDYLSSIVSKHLESEQLSNTMDKYEPKNITNIIGDITTRPNTTKVQKGSANQENNDLSVSNSMSTNQLIYTTDKQAPTESINSSYINVSDNNKEMSKTVNNSQNIQETDKITINQSNTPDYNLKTIQEILPATDASIFATHEQDRVGDQIKENITKINIHDVTTMRDLNTNYYVTDSYRVNDNQSISTFDERNFNKNGFTQSDVTYNNTNTYKTDEVIATTTAKNIGLIAIAMHNNTETTRANQSKTTVDFISKTFKDNSSAVISTPYNHDGKAISEYDNKNDVVNSDNKTQSLQKILEQSNSTTNYGSNSDHPLKNSNDSFGSHKVITFKNDENIKTGILKTHEQVAVENETQKRISIPYLYNRTTISNFSDNYVNENTYSNNQYKTTQAISELNSTKSDDLKNDNTTKNPKNGFVDDKSIFTTIEPNIDEKTTDHDYKFQNNKEIAIKELSNSATDDFKSDSFYNDVSNGFKNYEVIVTTLKPNNQMIKTALNSDLKINKDGTTNNLPRTQEKSAVMLQTQMNIATSFIHGEQTITDLNNNNYAKEGNSSKNQYDSSQTTNSGNDEVIVTTAESIIDIITTTVPNYNSQTNKVETTKNISKTHDEGVVKHETPNNITTLFIHDGKATTDLINKNYAEKDSSKNEYQSTQTTNSTIIVTTTELNVGTMTTTLPNYNFQNNKEGTTNNMLETHEKDAVMHETQKDITTIFIQGGKAIADLNNKTYDKEDRSSKNQYQSTQITNIGNDVVAVSTTDSSFDMITKNVSNYDFKINKEETIKKSSKTHEEGVVKHETPKNITTILIHDGKAMSDLNNKSYTKEDNKNQFQSKQTINSRNDEVKVTTTDSNTEMITTTVPNYNSHKNKGITAKNMPKTHEEAVVRQETPKNITTLFIHDGKATTDLNNKNYAEIDSSSKNEYQSTETTNYGNEEVIVTTTELNIGIMTTTLRNYNFQNNKEDTTNHVLETHEKGAVMHETQKDITTIIIQGGKAMPDLHNQTYAKEDSSSKNQYQSTQTTNTGNEVVVVTTTDSNIDMITKIVSNYDLKINKDETTKKSSTTHEEGIVKHETPKNITTLLTHDGKTMNDLNNKSYTKEGSSTKNQFQSIQTINSRNDEVKVTTTDSNTEMITTTVPNYNSQKRKEKITKKMLNTHEEAVIRQDTQKNITTMFIYDGKAMADLNNKNYGKEESSSKNQYQSTQTNSGNDEVVVTAADSNIDMLKKIVPNYDIEKNKELTTKNMSKTHKEGVVKHETPKNTTTLLIHDRKTMSDLNYKNYAKEDSSSTNQFQSTQTTNLGNDEVKVTTTDSNVEMITTTVPNYNSQKNKEVTTKNMSKTQVKQETQKNITTIFIHGSKATADLNNKNYVKEDSNKNQFQSTRTTNSGNHGFIVTTTESDITAPIIHSEKTMSDSNNKSFARDKDGKIHYESTQTSNQLNFTKNGVLKGEPPFTFNNSTNSFYAEKIIVIADNTTITTDAPDFMITKVDDSGLTANLNHYTDTFVSTYGSNIYVTKSNIDTDRSDISDRVKSTTHKNLKETESTDINGKMTVTQITNNLTFEPTSAPINELKISSNTPISQVESTISANVDFANTISDGKLEKNDNPSSIIGQEISSRTNRQAEKQMEIFKLGGNRTNNDYNITTINASEYPQNSSKKLGEDLTATRVPKHVNVKVLTTISEDFNSHTHKKIGITEKNALLPVISAKDFTTVVEDILTTVTTASYNLQKQKSTTSISKETMRGVTNGRETTVSSSSIMNMSTNTPQYDETKVVESKPQQIPSSESDKVTSVLNRAVNTRDATLLKHNSHTENYQSAEGTVLPLINLTSISPSPLNNTIIDTSVTKTLVETESATDILNNQPQQIKKTVVSSKNYFNKTYAVINENKPNNGIIKSIRSRDITDSKASTTSKALRMNEKFRNESVLNNNQQTDIIPSELSVKVGINTGLHVSTTEQNIDQMISKYFTDIKQNSSIFLRKTTPTYYASLTISSVELSDRSITTAKIKKNTASTIRNTIDVSDATLVTESTINKRKKKSKTFDNGKDTLVGNLQESDGNISSTTSNKYNDFSNISSANMTINADEPSKKDFLIPTTLASGMMTQSPMNINTKPLMMMEKTEKDYLDNRSKKLNKNFEMSESTTFFIKNGQTPYKDISVNSNYTTVGNDPQSVSKYNKMSTTRGSIKTTMKNTTTMTKRIRDVNGKSTNTVPTNIVVILFDYGRQTQKKEGNSATNYTNTEENPDDNINVESSSHNRYENTDPNDVSQPVEPMTNTNNVDNDNDLKNSPTSKVDVRVNDTVLCGRYTRGRYPDKNDCRKFYVCVGRKPPIRGICPNNTVYSELRKQCTRNLSHCVRNNKFKCLAEGRFSDFLKDEIYHICIKNRLGAFVVYRFQCQNGFRLDKKTVKCIKETENSSSSMSSASESSKSNNKSTTEKTSKVTNKFECQEEGKFADTRDCRTYYVCSKKRNVYRRKKKKCESDERFDRDKKKCVDAESYECDI